MPVFWLPITLASWLNFYQNFSSFYKILIYFRISRVVVRYPNFSSDDIAAFETLTWRFEKAPGADFIQPWALANVPKCVNVKPNQKMFNALPFWFISLTSFWIKSILDHDDPPKLAVGKNHPLSTTIECKENQIPLLDQGDDKYVCDLCKKVLCSRWDPKSGAVVRN
jgi:hypothetical protein